MESEISWWEAVVRPFPSTLSCSKRLGNSASLPLERPLMNIIRLLIRLENERKSACSSQTKRSFQSWAPAFKVVPAFILQYQRKRSSCLTAAVHLLFELSFSWGAVEWDWRAVPSRHVYSAQKRLVWRTLNSQFEFEQKSTQQARCMLAFWKMRPF